MRALVLMVLFVVAAQGAARSWRASMALRLFGAQRWWNGDYKRFAHEKNMRAADGGPPTCGLFTRESVVDCANKLADLNCNSALELNELETFKSDHFTWYEKTISVLFISPSDIMMHCDTNHDGKITNAEFYSNYHECLVNEDEMCHARTICERELQAQSPPYLCGRM